MSGKIFIIGVIAILITTIFAGLETAGTTNYLPMPYGKRDLSGQISSTKDFIGVRLGNSMWYTFVNGYDSNYKEHYFNANYPVMPMFTQSIKRASQKTKHIIILRRLY